MKRACDVLVVGGGIVGLSIAVHSARRGLRTTLLERGRIGGESTQHSGALLRAHYADPASAALARRGIEHFASFQRRYGGGAGYRRTGFAYIPTEEEVTSGTLATRLDSLADLGIETRLLDAAALRRLDPALDVSDVGVAAYEPNAGYADPAAATTALAGAAVRAGATLHESSRVTRLIGSGSEGISGALLADGRSAFAGTTVLCNGAWSTALAQQIGLELPIRPTAVRLALFDCTAPGHLTVIDAPGGIYFRPHGRRGTLVGQRTWTDIPLASPDAELPEADVRFLAEVRAPLMRRMPAAQAATAAGGRSGVLDMTPDGLPLVGPSSVEGLWLCCGWSGTGFKTAPAVGEALAGWLADGVPPEGLVRFHPARDRQSAISLRSPH